MKCLIVEDDFTARRLLQMYLSDIGECVSVVNGYEALGAFQTALGEDRPYDLVCLDIMMPGMDGYETLRAIRQIEKEHGIDGSSQARVIMTTVLSDSEHVIDAFEAGCESYIVKPIRKKELFEELEKIGLIELKSIE